jgi:hypothetical protein
VRSELAWLDPATGAVEHAIPYAFTIVGYLLNRELAFDDAGVLYAGWRARMGDGVSGSDVADGGIAAYDRATFRFAHPPPATPRWLSTVHGRASGAIWTGMSGGIAFTPDGEVEWTSDGDDPVIAVPDVGLQVPADPRLVQVPRAFEPYSGGGGRYLQVAFDEAWNRYITTWEGDRVIALDGERLRWVCTTPAEISSGGVPVLGLAGSLLLAAGSVLIAIE